MNKVFEQIRKRELAIQREIDNLNDEARLWKLANSLYHNRHLLNPEDAINKRTAHKFAVLGAMVKYLTKNKYNIQNGATAADIYHQIKRDFTAMEPNTFRSQLTRFKSEGRLTYNAEKGTWNLAKREEVAH